jgi:hypothetical protein
VRKSAAATGVEAVGECQKHLEERIGMASLLLKQCGWLLDLRGMATSRMPVDERARHFV